MGAWTEAQRGVIPAALKARHAAGRRIGAVCTGAMLLAEAGLLRGRRATTHHDALNDLAAAGADVVTGARFVDDGDIVTAAGVTSGIDLALWLVERELGAEAAAAQAAEIEWGNRLTSA
jgi:transcriptional regulator GlxA family with amidase domain